jgi:hypothetical protein
MAATAPTCRDNKKLLQSRVAMNANFDFERQQVPRYVINYQGADPSQIISLGLEYLQHLSTSLSKLVIYCNRSNDEQLDAKLTVKYTPCASAGPPNNGGGGNNNGGAGADYAWMVRYNLPGTTHKSSTQRKVIYFRTVLDILKFVFANGKVNLVELQSRGVKISDDKESLTLYYLPDA